MPATWLLRSVAIACIPSSIEGWERQLPRSGGLLHLVLVLGVLGVLLADPVVALRFEELDELRGAALDELGAAAASHGGLPLGTDPRSHGTSIPAVQSFGPQKYLLFSN